MLVFDEVFVGVLVGIFLTVIWVYSDATENKIGKIENRKSIFNISAGLWALMTLILWVVAFPLYIIKRKSLINLANENPVEVQKRNLKLIALAFAMLSASVYLVLLLGLSNTGQIQTVKENSLEICPNHTVEQMVNNFIETPTWESGRAGEGIYFVNIKGNIPFENKREKILLQFKIDQKNQSYDYQALEIGGISQRSEVAKVLLKKMCDSIK